MKKAFFLCPLFYLLSVLNTVKGSTLKGAPSSEVAIAQQDILESANRLLEKKDFHGAQAILKEALKADTTNCNVDFKLGLCMLKSEGEQEMAHVYLKKATRDMGHKYDFSDVKIKTAPYDALYFLGKAYLEVNEADSALACFKKYNDHYHGTPPISVETPIMMCYNAKANVTNPRDVSILNAGENVNSSVSEMHPVATLDNSVLFFSSTRKDEGSTNTEGEDKSTNSLDRDIYFSTRNEKGKWGVPKRFVHNSEYDESPLFLSSDGLTLYFRKDTKNNGDIYQTVFEDGVWNAPSPLRSGINSPFDETGMSISGDGQYLYFSSNRDGGRGKSDLYRCGKKKNGKWKRPENLGDVINTPSNEFSPFIHPNGKTLFFATNGNKFKGLGGYDIHYSERKEDGTWSEPQNMGYPINSMRDEFNYYITSGGTRYYSKAEKGKSYEIYQIEGGGYEIENLDIGTEVVTLTEEMDVTEVLEVVEEVETEVEVIETVETEVIVESEVEVIDLEAMTEFEEDLSSENLLEEEVVEEENTATMFAEMEMETIDSADREALIEKVKDYLSKQLEGNNSTIFKTIHFNSNSSLLNLLNENEREVLLSFFKSNPETRIKVIGHTDNTGNSGSNLVLSHERAKVVYDFLIKHGINETRIEFYGKGMHAPITRNDTEAGRSQNRRVEIILL